MSYGNRGGSGGGGGGYGRAPFGGFRSNAPKPVEVGKEYNVTITETSRRGDGVAKIDGFVIFVSGGQRGEQTRIKVTQVGPRFANGEKVEAAEGAPAESSTESTESTEASTEASTESSEASTESTESTESTASTESSESSESS